MKKARGFYQKPRAFALFWGISAVFPAGQAVGRVGMLDDVARQGEQGDGVGDDHELVEHVAQLPDEVVGHRGAEEDENQRLLREGARPGEGPKRRLRTLPQGLGKASRRLLIYR